MPTITLLSWNIEHFGPGKISDPVKGTTNKNSTGLFTVIAATAYHKSANVISILEISASTYKLVASTLASFLGFFSLALYNMKKNDTWDYIATPSGKGDMYLVLYKTGQGFEPLMQDGPKGKNTEFIADTTNLDINGATLKFQSAQTLSGGRKPAYFAFTTKGLTTDFAFSIIAYHAMFNTQAANVTGLSNISKIFPTQFVNQKINGQANPQKVPIEFSLLAGDYNVDLLTFGTDYGNSAANLTNGYLAIPDTQKEFAKSTLTSNTPPGGYPKTEEYRVNGYDNILVKPTATTAMSNNEILPMLYLIKSGNDLADYIDLISKTYVKNGGMINSNPPTSNDDAWHIYFAAISNHLPATASFVI